jgi:hypothetical protein
MWGNMHSMANIISTPLAISINTKTRTYDRTRRDYTITTLKHHLLAIFQVTHPLLVARLVPVLPIPFVNALNSRTFFLKV